MTLGRFRSLALSLVGTAWLGSAFVAEAQEVPFSAIIEQSHIHGLAVDPRDPNYLLVATHHGLFRTDGSGTATQVSIVQDLMSFTSHPEDPELLLASGHPAGGGNLGLIVSTDGGATWTQRSPGVGGPVDFHLLAISRADPDVVYGVFGSLQVSRDGGYNWSVAGQVPEQTIDIAASAIDADTLYAAAVEGLFVSRDAGVSWETVLSGAPVSLVDIAPDGSLYAFVLDQGMYRAPIEADGPSRIESDWTEPFLMHLTFDPTDGERMFAVTRYGDVVLTEDGGVTWSVFGN